jgi:uncharacterized membrane protein
MAAESQSTSTALPPSRWALIPKALLTGGLLSIIGLFVSAPPGGLLDKAKLIGYALCHQIPERSFFIHDHQYPLCARCTGMYLGLITGAVFMLLRGRTRAARMPPAPIVATLILFIIVMGIDGVNSTISIIPGAPQLYHTTNLHRIITGTLYGLALSALFPPIFNSAIWDQPSGERSIKNWRELIVMLFVAAIFIAIVASTPDWLLYPISIATIGGALFLLSLLNSVIALSARKLENALSSWRQMLMPMLFGLAMALIEITLLDALRATVGAG